MFQHSAIPTYAIVEIILCNVFLGTEHFFGVSLTEICIYFYMAEPSHVPRLEHTYSKQIAIILSSFEQENLELKMQRDDARHKLNVAKDQLRTLQAELQSVKALNETLSAFYMGKLDEYNDLKRVVSRLRQSVDCYRGLKFALTLLLEIAQDGHDESDHDEEDDDNEDVDYSDDEEDDVDEEDELKEPEGGHPGAMGHRYAIYI